MVTKNVSHQRNEKWDSIIPLASLAYTCRKTMRLKKLRLTILSDNTDLSPAGSLLSSAMTTQLAMIVMMMVHSKTAQLTNHVVNLRTGLEGVKRNKEVGPGSATPSFFLPLAGAAGAGPPMVSGLAGWA